MTENRNSNKNKDIVFRECLDTRNFQRPALLIVGKRAEDAFDYMEEDSGCKYQFSKRGWYSLVCCVDISPISR